MLDPSRRATVFVLSESRSGSTLLDQCLGAHPDIVSLGEVHWLRAYALEDRTIYNPVHPLVCSCGVRLKDCRFWQDVEAELGRPLETLAMRPRFLVRRSGRPRDMASRIKGLPRRLVESKPDLYRRRLLQTLLAGPAVARDSVALFDAVCKVTGRTFCVDSSKSTFRFRSVYDLDPTRTMVIFLARDFRAVVHSKMKRAKSLEAAALGWRNKMLQIEALTRDMPEERKIRMKYESFCGNPRAELARICKFLDVDFSEAMLQRAQYDIHHIGGSPSKFDPTRVELAADRDYERAFGAEALKRMSELVGDVGREWGY